mgnify:FL=1
MQYQKTGITVSDVARVLIGKGVDRKKCNEEKKGLPVIVGASSIEDGGLKISRWIENPSPNAVMSKIGDILVSAQGTCGKIGINNIGDAVLTDAVIAVRPIPPLVNSYFLVIVIVEAIEHKHIIPEFPEDTIGFQRCIKPELIGGIEFIPLDTFQQAENVQAMKDFVSSFREFYPKESKKEKHENIEKKTLDDCLDEIEEFLRKRKKSLKELREFSESIKNRQAAEIIQEELF